MIRILITGTLALHTYRPSLGCAVHRRWGKLVRQARLMNLILGQRSMSLFGGFAADELDSAVSFEERAAIWRRQASGLPG